MYNPARVKQSEVFQLLLLDAFYAQSASEQIIFQGGTALRWLYGGGRFSEDLDFVTSLPNSRIESLLHKVARSVHDASLAQFGPGSDEQKFTRSRPSALKVLFVYRPENQRQRIAVRLEFEKLKAECRPQCGPHVLRDLSQVAGLIAAGQLFLPYTSSIVVAETLEEILSDKVRALFERGFIKGRDVYDYWWMTAQLGVDLVWPLVRAKLNMYEAPFVAARDADFFQTRAGEAAVKEALESDLSRFIPPNLFSLHQAEGFERLIEPLRRVPVHLIRHAIG